MGQTFGKYEIRAVIGAGGFGRVYQAFDPTVGRTVAIKTLDAGADASSVERFRGEAQAAGNLRHKNIVTIYDFGENDGQLFLVMEHLEGEDLQEIFARGRALELEQKIEIMAQIADGLGFAHQQGVVHRDIKPANIKLLPDGTVKILDFGIARSLQSNVRNTQAGDLIGTVNYMAPEQFGGTDAGAQTDIWAYGLICYELLTGKPAFAPGDPARTMFRVINEDPEPIPGLYPPALIKIVNRCLAKNPAERYQSMADVRLDLAPILAAVRKAKAESLSGKARDLFRDRHFDQALEAVREAVRMYPGDPEVASLRKAVEDELARRSVAPPPQVPVQVPAPASAKEDRAPSPQEVTVLFRPATGIVSADAAQAEALRGSSGQPPGNSTGLFRIGSNELPRVHLTFVSSPDAFMVGRNMPISAVPFDLGRSGAGLNLANDPALSRNHARIDWNGSAFTITDLGSRNGVFIDGRRLTGSEMLMFGAVIRLSASTAFTFVSDEIYELPDLTGQMVDSRYKLVKLLRLSSKAALYEAQDSRLPHAVAVKLLSPSLAKYPGYVEQFSREAEIAARLRHPHICKVLDHGQTSIQAGDQKHVVNFICMEMMDGGSLAARLRDEPVMAAGTVAGWLDQLTDALDYAHRQGIAHNGLRPNRIVFDKNGMAYVTDFAIATQIGDESQKIFFGAPDFLAPEQWEGSAGTGAADQYSLAAIAYLCVTGNPAYERQQDPEVRIRNFAHPPVPAHVQAAQKGCNDLSPVVSEVLARAMSTAPADRFGNIREFFFAFRYALAHPLPARTGQPRIFISYRRDSGSGWARLLARELEEKYKISSFLDTQRLDTAIRFPAKLEQAIRNADIFVCLLAKNTLRSAWVEEEIRLAWESGKPMIPIFQESFRFPAASEQVAPHIQDLLRYEGVHLLDRLNVHVDHTIADLARMVTKSAEALRKAEGA